MFPEQIKSELEEQRSFLAPVFTVEELRGALMSK